MARIRKASSRSHPFPARWCWSAPARWAAPCWRAGSRAGSRRRRSSCSSRSRRRRSRRWPGAACASIPRAPSAPCAAIVIAVKPQVAPEAAAAARRAARPAHRRGLDHGRPHARLPRTRPCRTPRSCAPCPTRRPRSAAASPSRSATAASRRAARKLAHALLAATGTVEWVDDERLMDAVTAVSGSGPAYVFLLAEALAHAGAAAGLPPALAEKLARETVAGSGELLHRSPLPAATLRAERHLARRHHRRRARRADGAGRRSSR